MTETQRARRPTLSPRPSLRASCAWCCMLLVSPPPSPAAPARPWHHRNGRLLINDRGGNDSDPGSTPPVSVYDSVNDADAVIDDIFDSTETACRSSSGNDAVAYTCSSVGELLVTTDGIVDPIPILRSPRAALSDPIYTIQPEMALVNGGQGTSREKSSSSTTRGST